jgi:predicted negative regulator of RcsB-dependent stress response
MTRHPTARRVHRQETEPDDAFVAGVLETSAWAKKHQRTLIIGGVILAVAIVSAILWLNHRSTQRELAAVEISQVRSLAQTGNTALAIRELEQFVSRFGGTPSGDEARLLLARNYMDAGQPQQAASTLQGMARNVGSDLGVNAAMLLAAAQEATGNVQQAEETYLRVGNGGRFLFQRQEALDNVARLRLQQGNVAGAVQIYERLVNMTPEESPDRQVFELRLGEVQARAVSAAGAQADVVPAAPAMTQPAGEGAAFPIPGMEPAGTAPGATQPETAPPAGTQPPGGN